MCVHFLKFSVPYFFFFFLASGRCWFPSPSTIYLRALFSFGRFLFSLWRFTRNSWVEYNTAAWLANAFWPSKPLYCIAPIMLTLCYFLISMCQRVLNSTVSTRNQYHTNYRLELLLFFFFKPVISVCNWYIKQCQINENKFKLYKKRRSMNKAFALYIFIILLYTIQYHRVGFSTILADQSTG